MIVDAHTHIWRAAPEYPEPSSTIVSPFSEVPLSLLRQYMDEHGVDRAVLVQPIYPGEDNGLVADAAAADPERFAAVCVVDPRAADAADRLEYWVRERGCRGLRLRPLRPGEDEAFDAPSTYPLWERARDLGVPINVLARPEHVPRIDAMAARFSGVPVIVDHLAHPDVASGADAPAFRALLGLARLPNVFVKPTGFYYVSRHDYPWTDCAALFRAVYERFGPGRLIWGSDFPHVLLKAGYRRNLLLFERAYPYVTPAERRLIMGANAARLYWSGQAPGDSK